MRKKPERITVAKTLIRSGDDKLLYLQRADGGEKTGTDLPGGEVEYESVEQRREAAAESIRRETSLPVRSDDLRFIRQVRHRRGGRPLSRLFIWQMSMVHQTS
ncbi:hypothetical protein FWD20_03970 [Candidatus Saccharibacteria bacterium]|nr:hypothetical protein [Candidatus Saccharibacteria bacterium]